MSAERILLTLRARWPLFLWTWAATVAVVLCVSLVIPPRYKASGSVVIEKDSVDKIAGRLLYPGANSGYITTQIGILQSDTVARQVARAMGLQRNERWLALWHEATSGQGEYESWAASRLLDHLDVRPAATLRGEIPSDSTVLIVSYTSRYAHFAAGVVNRFVDAYLDTTRRMQTDPARQYNAFFDQHARQLAGALKEAQQRLSDYEGRHGLIPTDEGVNIENQRLAQLDAQVVQVQDELTAARSREKQAQIRRQQMPDVLNDSVVGSLTKELSLQEARLSQLKTEFGDRYPDVVDLRARISTLRARLDAAVRNASGPTSVAVKVSEQRLRDLRAEVERQRATVLEQKMQRDAGAVLVRDVRNAQRAYDAVLARANETALESKNNQTNTARLDVARAPLLPVWPRVGLNTAVATVVGLFLAVFVVLFKEASDLRLRTVDDVVGQLQQPVLLSLANRSVGHGYRLPAPSHFLLPHLPAADH